MSLNIHKSIAVTIWFRKTGFSPIYIIQQQNAALKAAIFRGDNLLRGHVSRKCFEKILIVKMPKSNFLRTESRQPLNSLSRAVHAHSKSRPVFCFVAPAKFVPCNIINRIWLRRRAIYSSHPRLKCIEFFMRLFASVICVPYQIMRFALSA